MKVYIETLGCPKNFNDTEVAKGCLCEERDFTLADSPEEADIIMVNTCGFINDAKKESIDKILEMSGYKESGESEKKLVVSGCLSERYSKELFDEMPEVDCFIGVNEYERLPEILRNLHSRENLVSGCVGDTLPRMRRKLDGNPFTSTLKIAEGCNNYCAYCVIPSIRGGFRSKKMEDVLAEAEELAAAGCKELILIAQDVTNYGIDLYGEYKLPELLRQLCRIDALHWIRLMYCYEDRITDELIEVMGKSKKICKHLHLPLQSGSSRILKIMNRRYDKEKYLELVDKIRNAVPDISLTTDIIVGFPGETEEDFQETLDVIRKVRYDSAFTFIYSKRSGTPAAKMENQVPEDVVKDRFDRLLALVQEKGRKASSRFEGTVQEILVEEESREKGIFTGRTEYNLLVHFPGCQDLIGKYVKVKLDTCKGFYYFGSLAE